MFKILLIVYILGGGGSKGIDNTMNTEFVFQEFYSMEDCELVVEKMKDMVVWTRGDDKSNKIGALYSTECVEMTAQPTAATFIPDLLSSDDETGDVVDDVPISNRRHHSRWDD